MENPEKRLGNIDSFLPDSFKKRKGGQRMWRDTIIVEEDNRIVATGDNVRMNTGEIADLFNITAVSMNRAVKRVLKSDVLNDYKVVKFVRLDNGLLLEFYSLEHIIVLSYKWNTFLHLCYWDKGKLATHSSNSFATIGTQPYHSVKPKRLCIAIAHYLATSYRCAPPITHAQHCHLSLRTCSLRVAYRISLAPSCKRKCAPDT